MGPASRATLDESPRAAREVRLAIARCKEGDRDALRLLYVRYSGNVYGYVRSIVRDDKEAEDLTQHVFLKLITAIVKYDDVGVPFSGWLLRLARNVALDHLRRRRATPAEEVYGASVQADESAMHRRRSLRAALATLPEEQRNVVVMRHLVGLTPPEIARRLGRSESSIHGLHHRGRRALQVELRRLESAPATLAAAS
jgi:RNA polymerase sigma-70 factor (ECF subfamily)